MIAYASHCSLDLSLPTFVWTNAWGFKRVNALLISITLKMYVLCTWDPATFTSTAKLVRWVPLDCTTMLFSSCDTWTSVVTPSVDQPPLPILETIKKNRHATIISGNFRLFFHLLTEILMHKKGTWVRQIAQLAFYGCNNICNMVHFACK